MAASALYACTKCTQRYPFEELSQGQQLCKVRGRWAAGGRGVFSAVAQESWVSAALQSRSLCRRLGDLEPSPLHLGTPLSDDLSISSERPVKGRQNHALIQAAQEGAGPWEPSGVSGVGLSEAATCLCRRDPGVEMFSSRVFFGFVFCFFAWSVLSFHREAGDGFCTFLLGT